MRLRLEFGFVVVIVAVGIAGATLKMLVYPLLHYLIKFVSVFLEMLLAPMFAVVEWIERNFPDHDRAKTMAF